MLQKSILQRTINWHQPSGTEANAREVRLKLPTVWLIKIIPIQFFQLPHPQTVKKMSPT